MVSVPAVACGIILPNEVDRCSLRKSCEEVRQCQPITTSVCPEDAHVVLRRFDIWFLRRMERTWEGGLSLPTLPGLDPTGSRAQRVKRLPFLLLAIAWGSAVLSASGWLWGAPQQVRASKSSPNQSAAKRGSPLLPKNSPYDRLDLKDGSVLVGLVLGENSEMSFFACRRAWLSEQDPKYAEHAKQLRAREQIAYEQLRDRLERILAEDRDPECRFVWEQELDRAKNWLSSNTPSESELILVELPRAGIASVQRHAPTTAGLAIWAWDQHLESPESKTAEVISKDLDGLGVDGKRDAPDLGRRFQAFPQDENEWDARCALVRFSRSKGIEFQGTPSMMMRVEKGKAVDMAKLLSKSLENQSQALLGELLGEKPSRASGRGFRRWIDRCISQLTDPNENYFRATQVDTDLLDGQATVTTAFAVRNGKGEWLPVWRLELSVHRSQIHGDRLKELESDPQIQSLLGLIKPLGLVNQETLQTALVMGAATKQAQEEANSRFEYFRQRYQHRLDLPILRWDPIR